MPSVAEDVIQMHELLTSYNFEVTVLTNPTLKLVQDYFKLLNARAYQLSAKPNGDKQGLVFFCYFSGHGVIEHGRTKIVLTNDTLTFALEKQLRKLKAIEHTYIVGLLDCCRQESKAAKELVRGLPMADSEDSEESQQNLILIFGCEPSASVKA